MPTRLPWWLSSVLALVSWVLGMLSARGAAERAAGVAAAERQERAAKVAGDAAADGEDDPRDLRED